YDGLSDACAAEEADRAALQKWLDEVDNLDAGLEHLFLGRLLVERRRLAVDGQVHLGVDRAELVDRLAEDVEHPAQRLATHRHRDACAGVDRLHASDHAFGCDHRDAAHAAFAEVPLYLDDDIERGGDVEAFADDANRLEDRRHFRLFKLNVNGRSADRNYFSNVLCHRSLSLRSRFRYRAAAPLTISIISLVIAACRTRFMVSESASIISEALLVAASMAVMRAACSA